MGNLNTMLKEAVGCGIVLARNVRTRLTYPCILTQPGRKMYTVI